MNKKLILILGALLIIALVFAPKLKTEKKTRDELTFNLVIDYSSLKGEDISSLDLPKGFVSKGKMKILKGSSASDAIKKYAKQNNMQISIQSSEWGDYIESLNNVGQGDFTSQSGWTYMVNGEFVEVCASEYKIKNGDTITFQFLTEFTW